MFVTGQGAHYIESYHEGVVGDKNGHSPNLVLYVELGVWDLVQRVITVMSLYTLY